MSDIDEALSYVAELIECTEDEAEALADLVECRRLEVLLHKLKRLQNDQCSFSVLTERHAVWSDRTFGTSDVKGPIGPLKHLIKEAAEAIESPSDPSEYADCLFLVLDAARRAGISAIDLLYAGFMKMEVLEQRTYTPDPSNPDETVEHDREVG